MSDILKDLSPERLVNAIEENLSSWLTVFRVIGESRLNDPPGVNRSVSSIPIALFNSIMDARLEPEKVDTTIQCIKTDAEARKVPVLWWVGPSTRPLNLGRQLEEYGFIIDDEGPGMAVNLASLNYSPPLAEGLDIHRALDDVTIHEWCATMAIGFEIPPEKSEFAADNWFKLISRVDTGTTQAFTARLHGKPVATSLLQLGAGVAGIYGVSTIPEARRKGIGAQVTLYPLLQAHSMGYEAGILQASEIGFPVYRSLGFQEYCRITSYIYRPELS